MAVVASFIAPYRKQRGDLEKSIHNFIEVFVDAPIAVCIARDPKGMYKKAQKGEIKHFTGISDVYEVPTDPDIHLRTDEKSIDECKKIVVKYLYDNEYLSL